MSGSSGGHAEGMGPFAKRWNLHSKLMEWIFAANVGKTFLRSTDPNRAA